MSPRPFTGSLAFALALAITAAACGGGSQEQPAAPAGEMAAAPATTEGQIPTFQVDPMWPKPLPNNWVVGNVIGISVDSKNQIWMLHRPSSLADDEKGATLTPPTAECCVPAPPVLVFDQAGNLLKSWGGPGEGQEWVQSEHGLYVDHQDNVWVTGQGETDQALKFTPEGKLLLKVGRTAKTAGSNDTASLGKPTKVAVDPETNEIFVADGYGNRRVIVFDANTGAYKRHWGAYGNKPDDASAYNSVSAVVGKDYDPAAAPSQQFGRCVHGVVLSKDGLLYVADRTNNRIQVFKKDGTFVKELFINKNARGYGSAFDVALSPDQQFLYNVNGVDRKINIIRRDTMEPVGSFGGPGRGAGQFYIAHSIAVDNTGNIYIGETINGKRIQRFVNKGTGPASAD